MLSRSAFGYGSYIGYRSGHMAAFFYYESSIGLVVKWKVHNGGLDLKNLINIF